MNVLPIVPGFLWIFGLVLCSVLLPANIQVSADSKGFQPILPYETDNEHLDARSGKKRPEEMGTKSSPIHIAPVDVPNGAEGEYSYDITRYIPKSSVGDGLRDCSDGTDELERDSSNPSKLLLRTYPNQQDVKQNSDLVFQCRDEGPFRAQVAWKRADGLPLPPGSTDIGGRLQMPNIQLEHSGNYVCFAIIYDPLETPKAEISAQLHVY